MAKRLKVERLLDEYTGSTDVQVPLNALADVLALTKTDHARESGYVLTADVRSAIERVLEGRD